MTILSGFAYGAWVAAVAAFCVTLFSGSFPQTPPGPYASQTGAVCVALAAFYLLPPGSVPPFVNISWGGILFYACLILTAILTRQTRVTMPCLAILVACVAFSYYARHLGMPGSPFNLGTFAAMPVWEIASLPEIGAFLMLGAGFILTVLCFLPEREKPDFAGILLYLAVVALFVGLFLPWNTASFVPWPDPVVAGVDFLLFWAKVLACCFLGSGMPRVWPARPGFALSVAGAVFLAALSR